MSYQNESKELIEAFKEEVTKKLPIWLKTEASELKDFLVELEDHIWDKATEYAEGKDPSLMHVREAIISMGHPRKIAKEFRTRGNPKFFITEELWPAYYKILIGASALVVLINVLVMAIDLAKTDVVVGPIIGQFLESLFAGFAYVFAGITLVFVQLSYHGFLPEDFKRIAAEADKEKERRAKIKPKIKPMKERSIIPSTGSYLFEGIMGLVGGGILVFYPFININEAYINYWMPDLPLWLKFVGGVMIISGVIRFSQALIGKNLRLQQLFLTLGIVPMGLNLALLLQIHFNPEIVTNVLSSRFPEENMPHIIKIVVIVFAVLSVIGMITEVSKIVRLEIQGFEKQASKYEKLMNGR